MAEQNGTPINQQQLAQAQQAISDVNTSVATLRTEADRARGIFGFGRRILVPPDEIHVVVGNGFHTATMASERKVFGQTAERPSRYWLNSLTQVIKLKTISFTVPIHGTSNEGVPALDHSKVSFRLWAHAVAKLNPDKAETAAQRVGLDTTGLIYTITKVGTAELVAAAATMELEKIIASRQKLAEIAFPKVNQILSELGYDLALLTVTRLDGTAYNKLIEQAEARVSKETGINTNREQLAELEDKQARERLEAEIRAQTDKKLASERLEAEQQVETATISQQEALDVRRHEMQLKQIDREKSAAAAAHETNLAKVQLAQQIGEAEAKKDAELAQLNAERSAELRALQQKREATIKLAEAEAETARLALEQAKSIERAAAKTEAEAHRLREEELAQAQRAKEIALLEASQLAEAMQLEAEAQANALQIKTDTETKMELVQAEAEATATEKRAAAAKIRAEATKAEQAALGLAEADVDAARVKVAEQQVAVTRAEGLAQAEVAQAQAEAEASRLQRLKEIEINAQEKLAQLYEDAPVLIEIEKLKMHLAHEESIAQIQAETTRKAFEALAPGMKIQIVGNGGQTSEIMSQILSLSQGLQLVGNEIPAVGKLLGQENGGLARVELPQLRPFRPHLQTMMREMNPRVFSSLKVADALERLEAVVSGQEELATTLQQLREDAGFRMVADMPVGWLLRSIGLDNDSADLEQPPLLTE